MRPAALKALKHLNALLPLMMALGYIVFLEMLQIRQDTRLYRALLVPATAFFAASMLRKLLNFKRPYAAPGYEPLVPREDSRPSLLKQIWTEGSKTVKIVIGVLYALWLAILIGIFTNTFHPPLAFLSFSKLEKYGAFFCFILTLDRLLPSHPGGDSFPSRHAASAVAIAAAFLYVSLPLGLVAVFIAIFICVLRPIVGVHYPRDVIAGAALSTAISAVGFVLIK